MNEQRANINGQTLAASIWRTPFLWALGAAFVAVCTIASLPLAGAASVTPAEMIQSNLPHAMTLANASKTDLLSAIGKAVAKDPKAAPEIVRTAAGARKELTADILKAAVRALHLDAEHPDCSLAHSILEQAIAVDGDQAASLTELFLQVAPGCTESPEEGPGGNFSNVSNINAATATGGGGSGASVSPCTVCHANQSIQVPCSNLDTYLKKHPGDTAGACEATPNANR